MFVAYVVVTIVTAAANIYAATADFTRPAWLLHNMSKLGVPESRLPTLGMLKAAGAVGLLIGLAVPSIGAAAAIGLILFFVAAITTHLRAGDHSFGIAVMFLLLAVAALVLTMYVRKPMVLALIS
jgi:DoxX-like protein